MCGLHEKIDAEFCIIFLLFGSRPRSGKASKPTVEINHIRVPGNSLATFTMHRLVGDHLCSLETNVLRADKALDVIAAKFRRKILIMRLIREGRANDRPDLLFQAIDLGSYPARADFAWFCFTANLPHQMCKHAFELLKGGRDYGCPDCTGMLAFYYVTGCRGVTLRCDDTAYRLACQSAAAGSWFGKMALVHFLNSLLSVWDPDEETFYVCWTDPFICNFASRNIDVPAPAAEVSFKWEFPIEIWGTILQQTRSLEECEKLYSAFPIEFRAELKDLYESRKEALALEEFFEPDRNTLSNSDIRRIARILIEEIQQEHQRNPNSPKVWRNLPAH
jgi:hypothetical protein